MGFTYITVHLYNPADLAQSGSIELLVDTGAIFTSIPRSLLEGLGIAPVSRRELRTYGGATVERDTGGAVMEYEGRRAVVPVIFGEPEDIPIMGATALESLGYQIDPVTKELKPIELLMV